MSLKAIIKDQSGFTYTLEAILGIFLIMGTVVYVTTNMPYTAQKTGEHSKVQLMNIGRDTIDLTLITPAYELHGGIPLARYRLKADNYSVKPGDPVNFTVYDVFNPNEPINNSFNFNATILFISSPTNITANVSFQTDGTGHQMWIPPNGIRSDDLKGKKNYEYSVIAYDSKSPADYSNFVTIKVGDYNLTSSTTSILGNGNVSGVVNYTYTNISVYNSIIQLLKASNGGPTLNNPNPNTGSTDLNGYFSFLWSDFVNGNSAGTYFIQAFNQTTNNVSNMHVIETSGGGNNPPPALCASFYGIYSCDIITVYEGDPVTLLMNDGSAFKPPGQNFYVNFIRDASVSGAPPSCPGCYITGDTSGKIATFKGALPGLYSVFICSTACSNNIWNSAQATNIILIYVLPIDPGPVEDTCVNATELNRYTHRYVPSYVNYNLYLIAPNGSKFTRCPDFPTGELINGYPTPEAVAVSKLAHIKYVPTKVDNILEYRMVLWYK